MKAVPLGKPKQAWLDAFPSYYDAWYSRELSFAREVKAADSNPFGDMYRPKTKRELKDKQKFDSRHYVCPIPSHRHQPEDRWRRDIAYLSRRANRRAALLAGDPTRSYVWYRHPPKLSTRISLGRWTKRLSLKELRENLIS